MINFFSYFPILLSLSLSFLLHAFNFKKHIHSLYGHATTFSSNNNTTHDKLHQHSISSIANDSIVCTESTGFESIDERIVDVDDQIDSECWRTEEEGRGNWRKAEMSFPPPLSSLDGNGQPCFILSPVRINGRLQLRKIRIKRPEIIYATRQDGRLRLFLVPDQCVLDEYDDDDVEQQECEEQEVLDEEEIIEVESEDEEEEITKVELSEEEEEMVEEEMSRYGYEYEKEDDRVREWKGGDNERFRRCYELVNHIHCINHVHSQHNLHMFGLSIA